MKTGRPANIRRKRRPAMPLRTAPAAAPAAAPMGGPMGAPAGIPAMKKGGTAKKTGPHLLHRGEKVMPKKERTGMSGIGAPMKRGDFPAFKPKKRKR